VRRERGSNGACCFYPCLSYVQLIHSLYTHVSTVYPIFIYISLILFKHSNMPNTFISLIFNIPNIYYILIFHNDCIYQLLQNLQKMHCLLTCSSATFAELETLQTDMLSDLVCLLPVFNLSSAKLTRLSFSKDCRLCAHRRIADTSADVDSPPVPLFECVVVVWFVCCDSFF
jgi:hypothetical protein